MARLFISHSSKENFEALAFREWLTQEGWAPTDIFLDLHGIGAGERWKEALAKANERCEAVVLLASPTSLASTECRVELRMAEDYGGDRGRDPASAQDGRPAARPLSRTPNRGPLD